MGRLTVRTSKGAAVKMDEPANEAEARKMLMEKFNKVCEKLAHYEDLAEAGRLAELPCKVGETVYIAGEKFPAEIEEIRIHPQGIFFEYVQYDRGPELTEVWDYGSFCIDEIGKTVFRTREEAEATLKGEKNGD